MFFVVLFATVFTLQQYNTHDATDNLYQFKRNFRPIETKKNFYCFKYNPRNKTSSKLVLTSLYFKPIRKTVAMHLGHIYTTKVNLPYYAFQWVTKIFDRNVLTRSQIVNAEIAETHEMLLLDSVPSLYSSTERLYPLPYGKFYFTPKNLDYDKIRDLVLAQVKKVRINREFNNEMKNASMEYYTFDRVNRLVCKFVQCLREERWFAGLKNAIKVGAVMQAQQGFLKTNGEYENTNNNIKFEEMVMREFKVSKEEADQMIDEAKNKIDKKNQQNEDNEKNELDKYIKAAKEKDDDADLDIEKLKGGVPAEMKGGEKLDTELDK